jgi:hypothetical protein
MFPHAQSSIRSFRSVICNLLAIGLLAAGPSFAAAESPQTLLLEAESFHNLGGWVVDQQFMDQTGSPFLLAHGLGTPVADATIKLPRK